MDTGKQDYFYVDTGKEPIHTDAPFRTETFSILFLKKGTLSLQADLASHTIKGPAVLTISPMVTRSFRCVEDMPEMVILFFRNSFLVETRADIFFLDHFNFFEHSESHIASLNEYQSKRLNAIFDMISDTFNKGHPHEAALMRSYTYSLIHEIDVIHKGINVDLIHKDDHSSLFIRFRSLLVKQFWRHRSVSFYSSNLNVSPKYLSEVIKKETGKTAGAWIDNAIILEAKVLLQNKDLSIQQIADKLNFSDQSVFGKFFKNQEGISPLEYRKSLGKTR
jgi:AraC-like DNA-binding protein